MSKLIHALGMKLQESVSSKVVYKVILVTHLQAIVQVKIEVSNSWTFSVVPRSFNANVNAGVVVESVCYAIQRPEFDLQKARYSSFRLCYFRLRL